MAEQLEAPEWAAPGMKVAELGRNTGTVSVSFDTVERHTATQIVLKSGARYRKRSSDIRRDVGGTWGPRYYLLKPDDPEILAEQARVRRRDVLTQISTLTRELQRNPSSRDALTALQHAASRYGKLIAPAPERGEGGYPAPGQGLRVTVEGRTAHEIQMNGTMAYLSMPNVDGLELGDVWLENPQITVERTDG